MAQNVTIMGASYSNVPALLLPKTGGGTARFTDVTPTTATDSDVLSGKVYFKADGSQSTGTGSGGGSANIQALSITQNGTYTASGGVDGYSPITVNVSGGVEPKQINFIDYDGTIVASKTKAEIDAMTSEDNLPPNPSHTGLVAQGWNWTLAQIKSYLTAMPKSVITVGQMYTTSDGCTRLYIVIPDTATDEQLNFAVYFSQSVSNGVEVDWGDGTSVETYSGTSATEHTHTYAHTGNYTISINVLSGYLTVSSADSQRTIFGNNSAAYGFKRTRIVKAEVGNNFRLWGYAFAYNYSLKSITLPKTANLANSFQFAHCRQLKALTIPNSVDANIGTNLVYSCYYLQYLSLPPLTSKTTHVYCARYCYALRNYTFHQNLQSIGNYMMASCETITTLSIPSGVNSIGTSGLATLTGITEYHFYSTSPPSLSSSSYIYVTLGVKIYVPYSADHSVLNSYKTASNWSTLASYIVEEPQ